MPVLISIRTRSRVTGLDDPSGVATSPPGENGGHGSGDTRMGHGLTVLADALCHTGGGTVRAHMPSTGETNFQRDALQKKEEEVRESF